MEDEKLTRPQAAERAGLTVATFGSYVSRGQGPPPDGQYDRRTPYWLASTIDAWAAARPGRGTPGQPRTRMAERLRRDQ